MILDEMPKNRILAGLPPQERDLLLPSCEMVELHLGEILDEAGKPIRFVHFPLDSAISVTAMEGQEHSVEVTLTGKEGSNASSVVEGDDRSMSTAMVQIPGTAIRIPTPAVTRQLPHLPYLRAALSRHNLLLMRNAVLSVGCSRFHTLPQRLARWLKAHSHRTGIESFPFSAQFLAAQVGAEDAATVAGALDTFQRRGIVKSGRNRVTISDHDGLARQACECYELAKNATEEYLVALAEIARTHGDGDTAAL